MASKYKLFKGTDGQYYFSLTAENGERILQSEGYLQKAGAQNGIQSCRAHSPVDWNYKQHQSLSGFWFTLTAVNGQVIGRSEMYVSAAGRDNGIAAVKRCGPFAPVEDLTPASAY
ncbi:DUF1508 domain-containing protein [Solimonas sp. K1W22B-7]|uniref:YegP family protein n=1 Tax=Solimonas sp. K1W22B-7 TaxID=2303331 RepID=UPI000E32DA02|nr:YegP family protein [Solimonas sp. K1W22B-7]AXQ28945.1 DUF1508 domain-containing protein [Solimonas sp. K1W22B-7]